MTADKVWQTYLAGLRDALDAVPAATFAAVVDCLRTTRHSGATIFLCGNGGSAATASHFAGDLAKGAAHPAYPSFRVVALTDNIPVLTAWANDADYSRVFVEPLRTLCRRGDVLIALSGSGNSPNVLVAAEWARSVGATVIGFVGNPRSRLRELADLPVVVPAPTIEHAEDAHLILEHAICTAIRALDQAEESALVPAAG